MKLISTSQLYNDPSFFKGVARSVDLFGTIDNYNESDTESQADYLALKRDWNVVGQTLKKVILSYDKKTKETSKGK